MTVIRQPALQQPKPLTTQDLQRARDYATQKHKGKTKQGVHPTMQVEYIAHALQVSKLLKGHGASIPEQIAGLVHGIPKNVAVKPSETYQKAGKVTPNTRKRTRETEAELLRQIQDQFGKDVRTMVAGITDLPAYVAPWLSRKLHYIQQIQTTKAMLPASQKRLAKSIIKLSIADEQACMASLIQNIQRAKEHKINPDQVFETFKTGSLPQKEALLWFFNKLSQTYHQLVYTGAYPNYQGKGLLQVYDETLKTLTQLAQPNKISIGLIRLKTYFTSTPNNPPLY